MVYRASDLGLNVKSQIFTCWGKKKGEEKRVFKSSEEQGTSLYFFRIQKTLLKKKLCSKIHPDQLYSKIKSF